MPGSSAFTNDDIERILRVVDRLSDVEVRIECNDLKLHVRKFAGADPGAARSLPSEPAAPSAPSQGQRPSAQQSDGLVAHVQTSAAEIADGTVAIRAPMLGKFFRAPSPSEPPYVELGKRVAADDPVCLIEVMKLFTTVNAGVKGSIVSVPVGNGEMVEHGQVLFLVRPE